MSKYTETKTELNDLCCAVDAFCRAPRPGGKEALTPDLVEVHLTDNTENRELGVILQEKHTGLSVDFNGPQRLHGKWGEGAQQFCNVVARYQKIKTSADVGLRLEGKKSTLFVSDMDGRKCNKKWRSGLDDAYAASMTRDFLETNDIFYEETVTEAGETQFEFNLGVE